MGDSDIVMAGLGRPSLRGAGTSRLIRSWQRLCLACCGAAWVLAGCQLDSRPVSSGLVILVESDLALPKDIDRLRLQVVQSDKVLLNEDQGLGEGHLLIPAEFRIAPTGDPSSILVRGIAYKNGRPRIERSAITTIPTWQAALLRLPFNFLCDGTVTDGEISTCGATQTCKQGSCETSLVDVNTLPAYTPAGATAASGGAGADSGGHCFDVNACFANAQSVEIDTQSCSIPAPPNATAEQLNLGLRMGMTGDGICNSDACWIALDSGAEGWSLVDGRILLPPSLCRERPGQARFNLVVSNSCSAKTKQTPPCGLWSTSQTPLDRPISVGMSVSMAPPPAVGMACEGLPTQPCGNCGTQRRTCRNGVWSAWSECVSDAVCAVHASQSCGVDGNQTCSNECKWGACEGQNCQGPATQACGNCGTQKRTCANGMWSAWSACANEGECMPNAARACGTGGTQACGGSCKWGACGSQPCAGAATEACGNCGTRTRTCDARTATWSAWSACTSEGMCAPNTTRVCGNGGMQTCGGNCQWDAACSSQTCSGVSARLCGDCGLQTRVCDRDTGAWSEWSVCLLEGSCAPNAKRSCGAGGTQYCNAICEWDSTCTGQVCKGEATQTCSNCGIRTRTCDGNTGQWSDYTACAGAGECSAGGSTSCGNGGTKHCKDNCSWDNKCVCDGPRTMPCGACNEGTYSRTCDVNTGVFSNYSTVCAGQGCVPGTPRDCKLSDGSTGTQDCGSNCQWPTSCSKKECPDTPQTPCGNCGTMARKCVGGVWQDSTNPADCREPPNACKPRTEMMCGGGTKMCSESCQWGACTCGPSTRVCNGRDFGGCGTGTQHAVPNTCDTTTGQWQWSQTCTNCTSADETQTCTSPSGGVASCDSSCKFGACACPGGTAPCNGSCVDYTTTTNCGFCGNACVLGEICSGGTCVCAGGGIPGPTNPLHCGRCGNKCGAQEDCVAGACVGCGAGQHRCPDGTCAADNDATRCGTTCIACPAMSGIAVCSGGSCSVDCGIDTGPKVACGMCGTYARKCNHATGAWEDTATCENTHGECTAPSTVACTTPENMPGTKSCNAATCLYDACVATPVQQTP